MTYWNDERLERVISVLLRSGVILSAIVVLSGGIGYLIRHGNELADYHVFHGTPPEYRSPGAILHAMGPSSFRAIIQFGLLLLVATPVARVGFSLAGFAMERDWTYVAIAAIVLGVLIFSLSG